MYLPSSQPVPPVVQCSASSPIFSSQRFDFECPHCAGENSRHFSTKRGLNIHISKSHPDLRVRKPQSKADNSRDHTHDVALGGNPAQPSSPSPSSPTLSDLPTLKKNIPVLKHVPRAARYLAAGKLHNVIDKCLQTNSVDDWFSLMSFAFSALKVPVRNSHPTVTAAVKDNIITFILDPLESNKYVRNFSFCKAVQSKVFNGDLRGAARLLVSESSFAPSNEETLSALKQKHPSPSRPLDLPPPPDSSFPIVSVSPEDVSAALSSFYTGSASGLDGLRPDHLKELTSPSAGDNGPKLLDSLTRLCNFLLKGLLNMEVCPFLYGGWLCALSKKDGGVRPIAIGNTLRRLVAKLGCKAVRGAMSTYLQPHQVGFGTHLGCEAAIHATRLFATQDDTGEILIKIDLKNAFNAVERDVILSEVREHIPELYPFLLQVYAHPSNLYYDNTLISSQVGAQQGDPLGPLLFSLAIQKTISSLEAPLNIWYLDDGTIGGRPDVVGRDIAKLISALKGMGLEVNTSKCEYYECDPAADAPIHLSALIPGIRTLDKSSLTLLGAPIFAEAVSQILTSKTKALAALKCHLVQLPAHVSLCLLRSCFAMPKMTYLLRTAPTWMFPAEVLNYDNTVRQLLEGILNIGLNDTQWCQAGLPIRHGGLGVRRLQDIGPCAYLASTHGCAGLVARMLPHRDDISYMPFVDGALEAWKTFCTDCDHPEDPSRQHAWDEPLCSAKAAQLLEAATGSDIARLKAASCPESGAWLHAVPSPQLETLLSDEALRVAAALRLGCTLVEPHSCRCGAWVDSNGHHGLCCGKSAGRFSRHKTLNTIIQRALKSAGVPCVLEPPGLSRTDGKRPDGLTLIPWERGRCLIWDATCVSTFAASHLQRSSRTPGAAAEWAAAQKHVKYAPLEGTYLFVPLAVEVTGVMCKEAKDFVRLLGRRLNENVGDRRSGWFLMQHISLAVQLGNASSVLGTFASGTIRGGLFQ